MNKIQNYDQKYKQATTKYFLLTQLSEIQHQLSNLKTYLPEV
jgi:hypothetical protein